LSKFNEDATNIKITVVKFAWNTFIYIYISTYISSFDSSLLSSVIIEPIHGMTKKYDGL